MKEKLCSLIGQVVKEAMENSEIPSGELPPILIEEPPQKDFGDFSCNFAMQSARLLKANPRKIAEVIVSKINESWIEKVEIAGPGFLNFYLKKDWLQDSLKMILEAEGTWGNRKLEKSDYIQVEFVSANPTGPLHVGHGRGAAVGSALANILEAGGYKVQKEYYINDAGNQIDNLALSVNARYLAEFGQAVEFPENGYHGYDIVETAKRIVSRNGRSFLDMSEEARLAEFKTLALKEKLAALKEDLESFGVTFDYWFSEQTLHDADEITKSCDILKKTGDLYNHEGAWWLRSTKYGDDKDRVVIRENGQPTYLAADIAYHKDKLERGFDRIINIWGADHHGYIPRMKAAVEALGYKGEQLEVLLLQMVNLYQAGQPVKMSKRTGQGVTLSELIQEVGRDAARYFFIMRSSDGQLEFDLDLAKSKSNENPVYYIQYAHARICSIFRQCLDAEIQINPLVEADLSKLTSEAEHDLIRMLNRYPEEIARAADDRAPHHVARFVHELAGDFHSFYNQCRIIGVDGEIQQARLQLVRAVQSTLKHGLNLLGISAPERM